MKRYLLLLVSFFLLQQMAGQKSETLYFSNLNLKDGLSQISVLKIFQDSKGFIWFATRNGLNRYDGNEFVIYKHDPKDSLSLSDNHIISLAEDQNRNLWIGTASGLNQLNLKTNRMKQFSDAKYGALAQSEVRSLLVDSRNRLWVGTMKGLYLYIPEMEMFQRIDLNGLIKDEFISVIYETKQHQILVGTSTKGLFVCDMNMKVQKHFTTNTPHCRLPSNSVSALFEDSRGCLWGGSSYNGLFRIDIEQEEIVSYDKENSLLTTNSIRCITESKGKLLVGTYDGLYSVDLSNHSFWKHTDASLEKGNLSHFSIYSLLVDKNQTIWVGTYAGGASYSSRFNNRFNFHDPTTVFDALFGIYGSMVCTPNGCLYMATEGRGLLDYNLESDKYDYHPIGDSSRLQYSRNIIKSLMLDGEILWCGTSMGTIYQFNTRTKQYRLYYKFRQEMSIYSILPADDGGMWVATSDSKVGLMYVSPKKELQTEFPIQGGKDTCSIGSSRCVMQLREGVILVGTRSEGLVKYDSKKKEMIWYDTKADMPNRLLSNYVTSIVRDSSGRIWIGTFGGGLSLYDERKGIVKEITKEQGLMENDICAIVEDQNQMLWISVSNGISKYDPQTGKCVNYNSLNGIGIYEFTPHSGLLLSNGDICFSGNNGFVTFSPQDLQLNSFVPPLVFTRLVVNNKVIEPEDESGIMASVLDDVGEIELDYDENNISISYSALNFVFSHENQYAVFLEGYDKEWNYIGNRRDAYYTNLSPGTYVFQVKASNNDGVWSQTTRKIHITVHPPVWKTWYAYFSYTAVFVSLLILIMYYISKKQKLEHELQFRQKEQLQLEGFHQAKIRMFTNFSHELRTPLTLIIAPLQELVSMPEFPSAVRNKLSLIFSNAQRLLLLVNQLMDLRKNQEGKLNLRISKGDMYPFLLEIYYAFSHLAAKKSIAFTFENEEEQLPAWFDKSLMEKVVFNLLSNAMKFTPSGGQIVFSLSKVKPSSLPTHYQTEVKTFPANTKFACLSVADSGKGITEEEIKNIFAPFYQGEDDNKENVGTGIGLSLTRSIVHLHRGVITVSKNQPSGTIFKVYIPISRSVYGEEQLVKEETVEDVIPLDKAIHFNIEKKWTVLLAEDNDEVRKYVKECLDPYFYVLDVANGKEALELSLEKYPDLILSDIMMPQMDGLELCSRVKQDLQLGHIPVVLMTAKSMVVHIKEGFSVGADEYIVKPFNMDVLICRIINILESRDKLKKLYGKKFSPEAMGIEIVSGDDRFTQRFFHLIEKNISNPELSVDLLSQELAMSRANLYRKLKAVTELSPTELIRNKRLEVAARLLMESDYTVSEISVYAGFNSHAYFTNCFKSFYGYSPSEWVQRHNEKSETTQ